MHKKHLLYILITYIYGLFLFQLYKKSFFYSVSDSVVGYIKSNKTTVSYSSRVKWLAYGTGNCLKMYRSVDYK